MSKDSKPMVSLLANQRRLVSPLCGIIKECKRVHKDYSEPLLPYIYRAELSNSRFIQTNSKRNTNIASGKGFTHDAARISALGEAVERYSGSCWQPKQIFYAKRNELPGKSLNPRDLVLYADFQYEKLRYAPYEDESKIGWVKGSSLATGEGIWIPAIAIFLSYDVQNHSEFICPITSNGLAAGKSLADAILKAAYEVIERDAFIICWMNQLPAIRVSVMDHPDHEVRELYIAYQRRGVEIELYRLPVDHCIPVFMALAVDTNNHGPAVVVGLGADLNAVKAARSAVLETAQVRPALRIRMRSSEARERLPMLLSDPQLVQELEDHDLLYASHRMLPSFDFMRTDKVESFLTAFESKDVVENRERLILSMQAIGKDVYYFDATPADMALLDLYTARAIIPDFQPIHFGAGEPRLGGSRLFDLPCKLGFRKERSTIAELNPNPHPLS